MPRSIGQMIDSLVTANVKTYHVQEWVYRSARQSLEEFAAQSHAEIQAQLRKLADLNLERNILVTEIDVALDRAIRSGGAEVAANPKVLA